MTEWSFYCAPNSQSHIFTPDDIETRGLGGAEFSLVCLTEELAKTNSVTVYNICPEPRVYNGVQYRPAEQFDPNAPHQIFVLSRNPDADMPLTFVNADKKLFFSCDQVTCGDYAKDVFPFVDHTVCISEYHRQFHINNYGVDPAKITAIDLGVRQSDYAHPVEKVPYRLIYCSVPSRGLEHLANIFPVVKHFHHDAELIITADFTLWGANVPPLNEKWKALFEGMPGVQFLGKVPRKELVNLQMSADILAYPNQPDGAFAELFGVSVAECQVAGAVPITSPYGAFASTVLQPEGILISDGWGKPIHPSTQIYRSQFIEKTVEMLANRPALTKRQHAIRAKARQRFSWPRIAHRWTELIESL